MTSLHVAHVCVTGVVSEREGRACPAGDAASAKSYWLLPLRQALSVGRHLPSSGWGEVRSRWSSTPHPLLQGGPGPAEGGQSVNWEFGGCWGESGGVRGPGMAGVHLEKEADAVDIPRDEGCSFHSRHSIPFQNECSAVASRDARFLGPIRAASSALGSGATSRGSKCVLWILEPANARRLQQDCGPEGQNTDDPQEGLLGGRL